MIDRYPTTGGATVDITYTPHSGALYADCTGTDCGWSERTGTGGLPTDPPEKEDYLVEKSLPESRTWARDHAATCNAKPHTQR